MMAGSNPIGTATPFDQLFLLQIPPPWERIALASAAVPTQIREPLAKAAASGITAYALLVDGDLPSPSEGLRLIHFSRTQRSLGPAYEGREFELTREQLAPVMSRLLDGSVPDPAAKVCDEAQRHLLVCTHGERDDCCGRFGEEAFRFVRDHYQRGVSEQPAVRVWRASHFGGHRFAPTMLDLPGGRCWGWLSEEATRKVVERSGEPEELRCNYRGCCAIPSEAQCAERDLFFEHGWEWLGAGMHASVAPTKEPVLTAAGSVPVAANRSIDLEARFSYRLPGGERVLRHACLEPVHDEAAPASCGAEPRSTVRYECSWR